MPGALRLAFALLLPATAAHAVIGGEATPVTNSATLEIKVSHRLWSGRDGKYIISPGTCSAVIVGLRPVTLLTASHCFRDPELDEATKLPKLEVRDAASLVLKQAFYRPIREVNAKGTADIAVLVFEGARDPAWRAIPVAKEAAANKLWICGFGYSKKEGPTGLAKCAAREASADLLDFAQFLPASHREQDERLYALFEGQFRSKADRFSSMQEIVGINRLRDGAYDETLPMVREGDSGGPWFAAEPNGELKVLALTSFVETFYKRNKSWPVFANPDVPSDDLPYAAYGVRLDSPDVIQFLDQARQNGAEILAR